MARKRMIDPASPIGLRLLFPVVYGDLSEAEVRSDLEAVLGAQGCLSRIQIDSRDYVQFSPTGLRRFTAGGLSPERRAWHRVAKKLRAIVFARDEYRCVLCGATDRLEADHIQALARGGSNDLWNLQTLCRPCNRQKWAN